MGLFDVFDKDKRHQASIERNTKKLLQIYGQADGRTKAIETLRDDGSEEAIHALLMRYTVRVEPGITDDEEKQWVLDILKEFGSRTLPIIERFIRQRDAVTWPLRAVQEIAGPRRAAEMIEGLLDEMAEQYQREHTKKITLIKHLVELGVKEPELADTVAKFLDDMDGDTVIAAIEALGALDEEGRSREAILDTLKEKGEDSARIRNLVFEVFAARGWAVKGYTPTVEGMIAEPYYLTSDGVVKRRP